MPTILGDPTLEALIADLDARSESQREDIDGYFRGRAQAGELSWDGFDDQSHRFMADKLVALDRDKAEFCYLTCRALGARRIVERRRRAHRASGDVRQGGVPVPLT